MEGKICYAIDLKYISSTMTILCSIAYAVIPALGSALPIDHHGHPSPQVAIKT